MSLARPFNTRPLYQQVADEFMSRIVTGRWPPGQAIDNEAEIARSLGISLGTARKAFDILVELDVLERHQGRGTIVPDMGNPKFRCRFSNVREAGGRRVSGDIALSDIAVTDASQAVAARLSVNERTPVLSFARRRFHRGRLFMIEDVVLRCDASIRARTGPELAELAARRWLGSDLATAKRETLSSEPCSPQDAAEFGIEPGAPVIRLDRVILSYQDRPLEYRAARCDLGEDLVYVCE